MTYDSGLQTAYEFDEILSYDVTNFMATYLPFAPSKEDIDGCVKFMLKPEAADSDASQEYGVAHGEATANLGKFMEINFPSAANNDKERYHVYRNKDGQLRFNYDQENPNSGKYENTKTFIHLDDVAEAIGGSSPSKDALREQVSLSKLSKFPHSRLTRTSVRQQN